MYNIKQVTIIQLMDRYLQKLYKPLKVKVRN